MKSVILISLLILGGLAPSAFASGMVVDIDHGTGQVTFEAIVKPGSFKIHGKGASPKGKLSIDGTKVSGIITFDLDTLDTGMAMRNDHMKKKYLQTDQFPRSTLKIDSAKILKAPLKDGDTLDKVPFDGILNVHGKDHAVNGTTTVVEKGKSVDMTCDFKISLSDYGIESPNFAGATVSNDVNVTVQSNSPIQKP